MEVKVRNWQTAVVCDWWPNTAMKYSTMRASSTSDVKKRKRRKK
jgi:hypothetical protein